MAAVTVTSLPWMPTWMGSWRFTFDVTTAIKKNHASTSNDDIFP